MSGHMGLKEALYSQRCSGSSDNSHRLYKLQKGQVLASHLTLLKFLLQPFCLLHPSLSPPCSHVLLRVVEMAAANRFSQRWRNDCFYRKCQGKTEGCVSPHWELEEELGFGSRLC